MPTKLLTTLSALLICLLLTGSVSQPGGPVAGEVGENPGRIQGAWRIVSREREGNNVSEISDVVIVFDEKGYRYTTDEKSDSGSYTVGTSRNPMFIDLRTSDGDEREGIFVVQSGTLKLCIGGKAQRPKRLTPEGDEELYTFKREKTHQAKGTK